MWALYTMESDEISFKMFETYYIYMSSKILHYNFFLTYKMGEHYYILYLRVYKI